MRRLLVLLGVVPIALLTARVQGGPAGTPVPRTGVEVPARLASVPASFPAPSWVDTVGPIALSSPTVATIDGVPAVVFGSENGELYVVDAASGANLPGWPQPVVLS